MDTFPKGTVHIIGVNAVETPEHPHRRIVKMKEQFFIGADTGVFELMGAKQADAVFDPSSVQTDEDLPTFPERALFVPAATHLAKGGIPEMLGRPAALAVQAENIRPVVEGNALLGMSAMSTGEGIASPTLTALCSKMRVGDGNFSLTCGELGVTSDASVQVTWKAQMANLWRYSIRWVCWKSPFAWEGLAPGMVAQLNCWD